MALGPGKYDHSAQTILDANKAELVVVLVKGGKAGSGMSVKGTAPEMMQLPSLLRALADQLEDQIAADLAEHFRPGRQP